MIELLILIYILYAWAFFCDTWIDIFELEMEAGFNGQFFFPSLIVSPLIALLWPIYILAKFSLRKRYKWK